MTIQLAFRALRSLVSAFPTGFSDKVSIRSWLGGKGFMHRYSDLACVGRLEEIKYEKPVMLTVYPNPLPKDSALNIVCDDLTEGYYLLSLTDTEGYCRHQERIWIDDEATLVNFVPRKIPAGEYSFALQHVQSGLVYATPVTVI